VVAIFAINLILNSWNTKRSFAGISWPVLGLFDFQPIIPSPQTEYYRHKMDFCAGKAPEGIILGMRLKSRSTAVVDIKDCLVFAQESGLILEVFRNWAKDYSVPAYELYKHAGDLRYVSLRHSKFSGKIMVVGVFALSPEEFLAQSSKFQDLAARLQNIPKSPQFISA